MNRESTDENKFIEEFRSNKGGRKKLVAGLISRASRLTLNVPRHGMARRIAERLREGPFSDYYEFEKLLARALHPLIAGLNLNVVSDLQVNILFSERYLLYARDVNVAMASEKKLTPQVLKNVIVKMAAAEGHYMVIKFYDLIVRGIDTDLYKLLKPVEAAVIRIKYSLGDNDEINLLQVRKIFREYRDRKGPEESGLLVERMEWDNALRAYALLMADDSENVSYGDAYPEDKVEEAPLDDFIGTSDSWDEEPVHEDTVSEPSIPRGHDNAITRYARLIKQDYLEAADPGDKEKIRGIVKGIYLKNEKVYDSDKAADVVREILAIWIGDESLDEGLRRILEDMADEIEAGSGREQSQPAADKELTGEPLLESSPVAADEDHHAAEITEVSEETETSPEQEFLVSDESGVSSGEMEALLDDISDEIHVENAETHSEPKTVSSDDDGVSGGEMEALLDDISDEIHVENAETHSEPKIVSSDDDGVSDGELDALLAGISDEVPIEKKEIVPEVDDGEEQFEPVLHENINNETESFVVKDEILFEDKSLEKKAPAVGRKKPQKVYVVLRDIANTDSRRNLQELVELLAATKSAADVSRYLLGAGVTPAVKYGVTDLVGCNDFEEAFDRINGSEIFDTNEKIIILEKWLKVIGQKKGWFETPHDDRLQRIEKMIELYAFPPDETAPAETPGKQIIKTGDESIRISHEIDEFQTIYSAGIDETAVTERLPAIQGLFDSLAAGDESAVHFAVYHKQAFVDFLSFIDENPGLKELLDIGAAIKYCKKKKII